MIGIFDSGIGGVTVFREILKLMPNYKYIYYSDSINNPYGNKSKEELIKITENIVDYLIKEGCSIIVIACNTASSICKDYLRSKYNIPIIAIEPAYKMVKDKKSTLVMATSGTINSLKFKELYQTFNNGNTSILECIGLADIIEFGDKDALKEYLNNNLKKYRGVENVVLGCTHYPLIKKEIGEVLGDVNFYDGSIGVAKHLREVANNTLTETELAIKFVDSKNDIEKEKRFFRILKEPSW